MHKIINFYYNLRKIYKMINLEIWTIQYKIKKFFRALVYLENLIKKIMTGKCGLLIAHNKIYYQNLKYRHHLNK